MSLGKVLYIVGPTATGKTEIGLCIAREFAGAMVSADSIQVYEELDIISGKDIPKGSRFFDISDKFESFGKDYKIGYYSVASTPIYLLDVISPLLSFSVSSFQDVATSVIKFIMEDKKLPIVVGGTGLYVKSLTSGIKTAAIPPDVKLRKQLEKYSIDDLQSRLEKIDHIRYEGLNNSDKNNKRRLIRGIEITESRIMNYSQKRSVRESEIKNHKFGKFENLVIGLYCQRELLKKRIDERVEKRIKQGAIEEAKELFKNYDSLSSPVKTANGYRQLFQYFKGDIIMAEAIQRWKTSEYMHAKNQMTWFKREKEILWFDIESTHYREKIVKKVKGWL